jgi:lipopolysaccharide transport system permease protein
VRVVDLTSSRELLWNLTLRELRGKYKRSTLGWAWSLLNPLATMGIYTFVFSVVFSGGKDLVPMASGRRIFALYLLCGLLPWNFVAQATTTSMSTLLANGGLVKKVWFPREVLVFAVSGSFIFSFAIEAGLLCVALLIAGNMVLPWLPVVLVLMALLAIFATGIALVLAALNVYFRDLGYLWTIFTQLWFFATPIVYPSSYVAAHVSPRVLRVYEANPMAVFAHSFRDVLYQLRWPTAVQFAYMSALAAGSLTLGLWVFAKLSPRFAEEL